MKHLLAIGLILAFAAPLGSQPASTNAALHTRVLADGTRSLLVEVRQAPPGAAIDELRIELPRGAADTAVLLQGPSSWRSARDGNWIRLSGDQAAVPLRLRIALFEVKELGRARVRARLQNRDLFDQPLAVAQLPVLGAAASTAGLLLIPSLLGPGESIDMQLLDPSRTPMDGQWIIGGVPASAVGRDRLRVRLPDDLEPGSGLRVSYFDVWGERIVDALSIDDVVVRAPAQSSTPPGPRITECARYGLLGESLCVCGSFPAGSSSGIMIDGQPASVISASPHVVHLRLPDSLQPGPHLIGGSQAAGFPSGEMVSTRALRLRASIDVAALLKGESTMMRAAVDGAAEPIALRIVNRTPGIISIPGGNYQELTLPADAASVERQVDARAPGNFLIDTRVLEAPCPCMDQPEYPSAASRQAPMFVPRRVLAVMAAGTPAATTAAAQALALANGLALVEVTPLGLTNDALVVFEILDGIGAIAKAAALAAAPNVVLAQPDFIYDSFQAPGRAALSYGLEMIGADRASTVSSGEGVRVAVIDTGIDSGHDRLQPRVAEYLDVTGTGWTPDVHGTLVAGVIAAEQRNGTASGVAPGATLVGVKACVAHSPTKAAARCWSSSLARGIDAASRLNVRVMNLSVGGQQDRLLTRMVDAAAGRGVAMVSAAGNDGPSGKPSYPAAMDNVIAVTAVDAAGALYQRATRGSFIDLAAPGVDVLSTGPGGREQLFSGTSAATAFASGALALLLQQSKLSLPELRTVLRDSARDLGAAGRDAEFGDGLLDVCRALASASRRQIACR